MTKATLRQQLAQFRLVARRVIAQTMCRTDQKAWIGMQAAQHRLRQIGISTHLAVLPWQPSLTREAQTHLAVEILSSQHGYSRLQARKALGEPTCLPLKKLQLKGRAKWMASIQTMPHPYCTTPNQQPTTSAHTHQPRKHDPGQQQSPSSSSQPDCGDHQPNDHPTLPARPFLGNALIGASAGEGEGQDPLPQPHRHHPQPQAVFFQCPRCPHMLPAWNHNFATTQLDRKVWCNPCRRSIKTTLWQCSCGLHWHCCPHHHLEPERLRNLRQANNQASPPQTSPKPKAKAKTLGRGKDQRLHQWLDQPPKRSRPPPAEIELGALPPQQAGLKHYLLSPNLRAKFPRLYDSDSHPKHQQVGTSSHPSSPDPTPT